MPQLMAEAKKRQGGDGRYGSVSSDTEPQSEENTAEVEPTHRSRQAAAEIADVSQQTIQRAWEVTKADPELAKVARENKLM